MPLHRRPDALGGVLVVGVLGTLARQGLSLALPGGPWPAGTFAADLLGALLLGALLAGLARAGGVGAVTRFAVDGVAHERWGGDPYGVLAVNVSGSLLLGLVVGLVLFTGAPGELRLVAGTRFCGGCTTFSTTSVDTVRLAAQGRVGAALAYAVGTLVLTLLAGGAGLLLSRI